MRHLLILALATIGLAASSLAHGDQFQTPVPVAPQYAPAGGYVEQGGGGGYVEQDQTDDFGAYLYPGAHDAQGNILIPANLRVADTCVPVYSGDAVAIVAVDPNPNMGAFILWEGAVGPDDVFEAAVVNSMIYHMHECKNLGVTNIGALGYTTDMFIPYPYGMREWNGLHSPDPGADYAGYGQITYLRDRPGFDSRSFGRTDNLGRLDDHMFGNRGGIPLRPLREGGARAGARNLDPRGVDPRNMDSRNVAPRYTDQRAVAPGSPRGGQDGFRGYGRADGGDVQAPRAESPSEQSRFFGRTQNQGQPVGVPQGAVAVSNYANRPAGNTQAAPQARQGFTYQGAKIPVVSDLRGKKN